MALRTLSELRTNLGSTVRETQVNSLITDFLNLTLMEIGQHSNWSWLRRKTTFATVVDQENYSLDEEVDRVALLRDITNPRKLIQVTDPIFYKYIPNPENVGSGTSRYYRLWEETGFSTQPTSAEAITVESSSTSDGSSFKVAIVGRESTNNLVVSEEITMNGTTEVTSANTYAISGLLQCAKSGVTTGTVTIRGATSNTVLARIAPEETAPRVKRLSLYPIPAAVVTLYMEYYERIRLLRLDTDVPQMDHKWMYVLREGALARLWDYKQNEQAAAQSRAKFEQGLFLMKRQDDTMLDYLPVLESRRHVDGTVQRNADSVNDAFPSYSLHP